MRLRSILGGLAIVLAGGLAGGLVGGRTATPPERAGEQLGTYTHILNLVQERAAGEVNPSEAIEASIRGMLRSLDPHSNYLDPDDYRHMMEEQQGSFSGLGIVIWKPSHDLPLTVISPLEGTPAWEAGIRAGDVISQIEGVDTLDMSIEDALRKLKGPKGTRVTITVTRPGDEAPLTFTITRDNIPTNSIRVAFMIQPSVGYIRLESFTRTSDSELGERIRDLEKQGMRRLVLDLRQNPGGLLEQAVRVAGRFLKKEQLIVYTQGRIRDSEQEYRSNGTGSRVEMPLVVLVDKFSASASEIVAGALQDHDRALIVGQTTWGKGLVQTVYPLSHGAALALTTARYYTPSGRSIQAKGITPDIIVEEPGSPEARLREADLQRHLDNEQSKKGAPAKPRAKPVAPATATPVEPPKPIELGSKDDFQLQQAIAFLKGEPFKGEPSKAVAQNSARTN